MINTIDNKILREMFHGAYQNLMLNKDLVDSLNVFPVPDGDTGTNMGLTMTTIVKEMDSCTSDDYKEVSKVISKGALKGARGNSGVILSQIFKGMTDEFVCAKIMNTRTFAKAMAEGSNKAYHAVTQPKEGTILTVIRVMSEYAVKIAPRNNDFLLFFSKIIDKGNEILKETPTMLPILAKAGVVDSGGQGLMFLFIGMYNVLAGVEMTPYVESTSPTTTSVSVAFENDEHDLEDIKFAYCTEFFIVNLKTHMTTANIDKLRDKLMKIGDCVLVIGDLDLVKVHVHTNQPDIALGYALEMGELERPKIENMLQQSRALIAKKKTERKELGLLAISSGAGFASLFGDFKADKILEGGQTMNPSVDDIVKMVNSINANNVIVLPNNKNIILACEQAKELVSANLVVVATTNIPEGVSAAMSYEPDGDLESVVESMTDSAKAITCIEVTHAVRDTEMDGFKLKKGDYIALEKGIIAKGNDLNLTVLDALATKDADDICVITLYYGEDVKPEDAESLTDKIREIYSNCDVMLLEGGQPHYFYMLSVE